LKCVFVLLLICLVIGLLLPQQYQVRKSIEIDANASTIHDLVSDFNQWPKWSPWEKIDPSIKFTLGAPSAGTGAHQSWISEWGNGEMTITSLNDEKMAFNILFNNDHIVIGTLELTSSQAKVTVTCNIEGQATMPFLSGYMAIISKDILENMIVLGLNNLKTVAQLTHAKQVMDVHNNDNQNSSSKD
jgi:hypothetical protein